MSRPLTRERSRRGPTLPIADVLGTPGHPRSPLLRPLVIRSVDPTEYAPLGAFDCGGSTPHEVEVNNIARALYAGAPNRFEVRIAEDGESGDLVGVCAIGPKPLPPLGPVLSDAGAAYIGLIGVQAVYRGRRLLDGRRIGEQLLADALDRIFLAWRAPPMPMVWALVASANQASHRLFADFGFGLISSRLGDYDIRLRAAGVGLRPSQ